MSKKRITRRQALATGLVGAATLASCGKKNGDEPEAASGSGGGGGGKSVSGEGKSAPAWVHYVVLPRMPETRATFADGAANPVVTHLTSASYTMKVAKDTEIKVVTEYGLPAWVKRADVVPATEAVGFFSTKLAEAPTDTFALNSRGWAYYLLGEYTKAVQDFDEFLRLTPPGAPGTSERWEGLVNRGLLFAERGEFEKALKDLDEAVNLAPLVPLPRVNRGFVRELQRDYTGAIEDYARGTSTVLGVNNHMWAMVTYPGQPERAAEGVRGVVEHLCEVTQNLEGMYLDTLAAAYASAGQFDDAVKSQEKALEDKSFVARYGTDARKRLQLYQDKKPFRMPPKT